MPAAPTIRTGQLVVGARAKVLPKVRVSAHCRQNPTVDARGRTFNTKFVRLNQLCVAGVLTYWVIDAMQGSYPTKPDALDPS